MEKKYRTEPEGDMLRIIALKDFADVKKGDRGGLIEKEENLSQEGNCWIYDDAYVFEDAFVFGNAKIFDNAQISGKARVFNNAQVYEDAEVCGRAFVYENARILGHTRICGVAWVCRTAKICSNVKLWTTKGFYLDNITTSIKDSKDYIILGTKGEFRIFPSNIKNLIDKEISIVEKNYIKNIKIIRQLYGNEI